MKTENEELKPIDLIQVLRQFLKVFRRFWLLVLVLGILCAAVSYVREYRSFRPQYEAQAQFSVSSGYSADDIFNSSYYDNAAAEQLAAAFPYMLRTELMQDLMKQQLGVSWINGTITPSSVANTNMFTLTVRSSSAEDAYNILCAVIDCYPQVAVYMVDNPQVIIRRPPTMPTAPYNSFSWKDPVIKGGVLGVAAGLVILFVIAFFTKTVSTVEQLKALVNMPVLTVIPQAQAKKRRNEKPFVMVTTTPALEEPLHGLNLKVRKLLEEKTRKVILITSTLGGEGKTTVAANLALSLAAGENRVVLVDADLRSQSIAERFGRAPGERGLMECMKDPAASVLDSLVSVTDQLYYLSGPSVADLHYSIDAKGMRRILTELTEQFDYVVMDTSPCAMVSDTALLCHYADCVLYVVKPDCASQTQIFDTVNDLYNRGAPVSGLVFNNVPVSRSHYGHGSRYGYGYGYKNGYSYGKKNRSK